MAISQRGMGCVGIIATMVVAGLIVYGVVYYGPEIWIYIKSINLETTSIQEINEHPERYAGKEVTVEGYVTVFSTPFIENGKIRYSYTGTVFQKDPLRESPNYFLELEFSNNLGMGMINFARYRLTGTVKKKVTPLETTIKLIVSQVEPM